MKYTVGFASVLYHFISLCFFVVIFAMKLRDVNYKSHCNILVFCDQWKMMLDLNMFHGKMSDFVSFRLEYVLSNSIWFSLSFAV